MYQLESVYVYNNFPKEMSVWNVETFFQNILSSSYLSGTIRRLKENRILN